MKRRLLRLGLYLLAGAIVNITVAWALINFTSSPKATVDLSDAESLAFARRYAGPAWPPEVADGQVAQTWAVERVDMGGADTQKGTWVLYISKSGFPLRALAGGFIVRPDGMSPLGCIMFDKWDFPYLPLWPGFAINMLFYAGILWLLFAALFQLRHWRRTLRGQCPTCAYDLRGTSSAACPECGNAIRAPIKMLL